MKVTFQTNLDAYRSIQWPSEVMKVPIKGERVMVDTLSVSVCQVKGIPPILEVCEVTHYSTGAIVELYYSSMQQQAARLNDLTFKKYFAK